MFRQYKTFLLVAYAIIAVILFGTFIGKVEAESINAGALRIEYAGAPGPLFNSINITPGYSSAKEISVTNTGRAAHSFSIAVDGRLGSLADVLIIEPAISNQTIWSKTLSEMAKNPESNLIIGSIPPDTTRLINLKAYLPYDTGNNYQSSSTANFSFVMGNENTDQVEPDFSSAAQQQIPGSEVGVDRKSAGLDGQVEGAATGESLGKESERKNECYWWWSLSILFALLITIYGIFVRKGEVLYAWFWPVFGGVIIYLVHWIMHNYYLPVKWCDYFILYEAGILISYYFLMFLFKPKLEKN